MIYIYTIEYSISMKNFMAIAYQHKMLQAVGLMATRGHLYRAYALKAKPKGCRTFSVRPLVLVTVKL